VGVLLLKHCEVYHYLIEVPWLFEPLCSGGIIPYSTPRNIRNRNFVARRK